MSKGTPSNTPSKGANKLASIATNDLFHHCRSTFKLTFAVEVLGMDVWEDSNELELNQGNCQTGLKIQYQLYPGQTFELDIMIWPYTAKIWFGSEHCWVRTWQLLESRWLCFSINHAFPVRVVDLQAFVATVNPTFGMGNFGSGAKNDKNFEVCLPPLGFGERRYFGRVLEKKEDDNVVESLLVGNFIRDLLWNAVMEFIPANCFDDLFDCPHVVRDVRHQDRCLDTVRDLILSRSEPKEELPALEQEEHISKEKRETKKPIKEKDKDKEKEKKKPAELAKAVKQTVKLEIKLPGESILAGSGRIVAFETIGDPVPDSPQIIVLISSNNLPAPDDLPIVFLNVENLCQIPLNELKILRTTQIYTKWKLGDHEACSQPQPLRKKSTINFNDHRALPIFPELLPKITSEFLDHLFSIEVRGIRLPSAPKSPKLFGYEKNDRDFGKTIPKTKPEELDFPIAVTRIDAKSLARGINTFLRGEYPLYPPTSCVRSLEREGMCTNDINAIRAPIIPSFAVPSDIVLQAQMTLEVSMGIVGCKTRKLIDCYSRMFCTITDSETTMEILRCITQINEDITMSGKRDHLLSGFVLDTGSVVILFVEGPRDGCILRIWEITEDYYGKIKPVFSCSHRYSTRIYPEFIAAVMPFVILKMYVPLNVILACPPIYARPALPMLTRSAIIKIGNLVSKDLRQIPTRCQMPSTDELKSFRLEMCVAPRPSPLTIADSMVNIASTDILRSPVQSVSRINFK